MSYRRKHIKHKIRHKKSVFKMPAFWLILFIFIFSISIGYFILFYSKFQISKINISGNKKVKSQDIENLAWLDINKKIINIPPLIITTKSIFTVDSKKIVKHILSRFPGVEQVEIQKKLPDDIILTIKERKPFAVFCPDSVEEARLLRSDRESSTSSGQSNRDQNKKRCFFLDDNGIIFDELSGEAGGVEASQNIPPNMIIVRKEANNEEIFGGENVVDKNTIAIISKVQKELKNNFQIGVKEVLIYNYIIFKTSEGWQIYFDVNSDIDLAIIKMNILLNDEIPVNTRKNLQYIYLQYKDKAYYK